MGVYDAPKRTAIVRSTLPSTTQRIVLLVLSMHIARPVVQRGSSRAVGGGAAGEPVGELVGGRRARHRGEPVQGAPVDVPGHRDLALLLEALHRGGRGRAVVVGDVAGVPRDLPQPRLQVADLRRRGRRGRGGADPAAGSRAGGPRAAGRSGAAGRPRAGRSAWRTAWRWGSASGSAAGRRASARPSADWLCEGRRGCPALARATPYPSAEVPRSTPATMATVATLFTPAPMVHILARVRSVEEYDAPRPGLVLTRRDAVRIRRCIG